MDIAGQVILMFQNAIAIFAGLLLRLGLAACRFCNIRFDNVTICNIDRKADNGFF